MNPIRALAWVAVTAVAVAAGAAWAAAIQGRVVQRVDDAPIPGAFVVLKWDRPAAAPAAGAPSCAWVEVVRTDPTGTYVIPARGLGTQPSVTAYVPGMVESPADYTAPGAAVKKMEGYRGTDDQRAEWLEWMSGLKACPNPDLVRILTPLYQAADAERRGLALKDGKRGGPDPFMASLESLQRERSEEAARTSGNEVASPGRWDALKNWPGAK